MLNKSWDLINKLRITNAKHLRKGYRLGDLTDVQRLQAVKDEVIELQDAPNDIHEMADILAILFHHAQLKGWTQEDIDTAICEKLNMRFDCNDIGGNLT